jgi:hypothetical protein
MIDLNPEYGYIVTVLLAVGAVLKHSVPHFPNRLIPLVTLIGGTLAVCLWAGNWDKQTILAGIIVSLAATGMHGTAKNITDSTI